MRTAPTLLPSLPTPFQILGPILLLLGVSPSFAIEKHWIAHEAQVIVIGTYQPNPTYPWWDGWHLTGTIQIDEVLYGPQMPRQIKLRLVCAWNGVELWPPPRYPETALVRGLWFLRRIDGKTWGSPLGDCDSSFLPLTTRAYWEKYIRQSKIHPWPGFHAKTSNY